MLRERGAEPFHMKVALPTCQEQTTDVSCLSGRCGQEKAGMIACSCHESCPPVIPESEHICCSCVFIFCLFFHRSEGFPRTRITKRSCACDCGRGPVSIGAFFFFLSSSFFFLLSSSLTQNRALKLRVLLEKAMLNKNEK